MGRWAENYDWPTGRGDATAATNVMLDECQYLWPVGRPAGPGIHWQLDCQWPGPGHGHVVDSELTRRSCQADLEVSARWCHGSEQRLPKPYSAGACQYGGALALPDWAQRLLPDSPAHRGWPRPAACSSRGVQIRASPRRLGCLGGGGALATRRPTTEANDDRTHTNVTPS